MNCTWVGCTEEATNPQLDKTGKPWANLCKEHHAAIEAGMGEPFDPKKLLGNWVKAHGGADKLARKMTGGLK